MPLLPPRRWGIPMPQLWLHSSSHGANRCYQAGALDAICLCPDCWGIWRSALLAAPRRPARTPLPPGNLLTHLIQVSQQCQAGAGANTFHARSSDRQRVRRWCLRALPRDWTAFPDLLQQAERSLTEVANVAELLQDGLRHWHRRGDADTQVALGVLHFRRRPPA